ncbi:hypothetical protein N431DRAFT_10993 [Stipitochalara longipes BDJ]|nr:hypothetical protein N431DRAFT_10993 [Stipitochalara longipes BDJ]
MLSCRKHGPAIVGVGRGAMTGKKAVGSRCLCALCPTQPLCNVDVAGETRVRGRGCHCCCHCCRCCPCCCRAPAPLLASVGLCPARAAARLGPGRKSERAEDSGAGRLAMGLHDSMRRLAKIARRAPCLAVLDIALPQSLAACLPAASWAPWYNNSLWPWCGSRFGTNHRSCFRLSDARPQKVSLVGAG